MSTITTFLRAVSAALVGVTVLISTENAYAYNPTFRVNNYSDANIREIRVSDVDQSTYGSNILRSRIWPGESVLVYPDDGRKYCRFDMKITLSDGTERFRRNFNACVLVDINVR